VFHDKCSRCFIELKVILNLNLNNGSIKYLERWWDCIKKIGKIEFGKILSGRNNRNRVGIVQQLRRDCAIIEKHCGRLRSI
jgi:hypothetical protein